MLAIVVALLSWFQRCASVPHCVECVPKNPPAYPPFFPVFSWPEHTNPELPSYPYRFSLTLPLAQKSAIFRYIRALPLQRTLYGRSANVVPNRRSLCIHPHSLHLSQLAPSTPASNLRNR